MVQYQTIRNMFEGNGRKCFDKSSPLIDDQKKMLNYT